MATYRWNTNSAAETFDAAAPAIHPFYLAVQEEILHALSQLPQPPALVVDLGGGSGRLLERVLEHFPDSTAVLVDQSPAFLTLAARRLEKFGPRATLVEKSLQDDWSAALPATPDALVSTSAIHHLEPAEKQSLYRQCYASLTPGGIFLNGDELRLPTDTDYLAAMEWWCQQKDQALAEGRIPESFRPRTAAWRERNIAQFGQPKQSGDDCHETAEVQLGYLRAAGFCEARLAWHEKLWGLLLARK